MKLHTKIYKRLEKQHPEFSRAQLVDATLEGYNKSVNGYGIESIIIPGHWSRYYCDICFLYVNIGDTYTKKTLIYNVKTDRFSECTIGNILERHTNKNQ